MRKLTLLVSLLSLISGCGEKPKLDTPGLTDLNATAIALNNRNEVIDFVHVQPDSGIDRVEFHAPENGDEIQVFAVGPAVHPDIPSGVVVSSKFAEGFKGKVTVEIEDGMIVSILGNGLSYGNPLDTEDLQKIKSQLNSARDHLETTTIIKDNKYLSGLVEDSSGNLAPNDLTQKQGDFISDLIAALNSSDFDKLATFVHRDKDDSSSINTVLDFLEFVSKEEVKRYRFMRFDPEHPDNKSKIQNTDGETYRYSLPIEWVFTAYFSDKGAQTERSADLLIGSEDGRLMLPTKYAE